MPKTAQTKIPALTKYPQKSKSAASEWSLQDAKAKPVQEAFMAQVSPPAETPKKKGRPKKGKG